VSILKLTIPQVFIVPAFLAFQILARPLMLCLGGPCEMVRCEMPKAERARFCVTAVADPEPAGCCAMAEEKSPPKSSPCGGCGGPKAAPPKADFCCGMDDKEKPESWPAGCDERRENCPGPFTTCSPCLPIPTYAEPTARLTARVSYEQTFIIAGLASRALVEADRQRVFLHAHSPPSFVPARAGPQICIENCSFLI
jgi:hypothetical protein